MARAKKKTDKTEPKPPERMWVRYNTPPSQPHGPCTLGKFPNHKGRMLSVSFQPGEWKAVSGVWAQNLQEHPLGKHCDFSEKEPKE